MLSCITLPSGLCVYRPSEPLLRFCRDWYSYYDGVPSSDPDSIDLLDVLVTVSMNSYLTGDRVRAAYPEIAHRCNHLLAKIPLDANLLSFDLSFDQMHDLITTSMQIRWVGVAVATKIFHRKRPFLIPMLDRVVVTYYGTGLARTICDGTDKVASAKASRTVIEAFRRDLEAVREPINTLCSELEQNGFHLSPVRVMEILIWTQNEKGHRYDVSPPTP